MHRSSLTQGGSWFECYVCFHEFVLKNFLQGFRIKYVISTGSAPFLECVYGTSLRLRNDSRPTSDGFSCTASDPSAKIQSNESVIARVELIPAP